MREYQFLNTSVLLLFLLNDFFGGGGVFYDKYNKDMSSSKEARPLAMIKESIAFCKHIFERRTSVFYTVVFLHILFGSDKIL